MKRSFPLLSAVAIATMLGTTSCASIVSDSQYPVSIQSSPSNVNFTIKDEYGREMHSGKTPLTVTLAAGDGYFSKAKYTVEYKYRGKTTTTAIIPTLDGWYIGNFFLPGGLIGLLVVDPVSGAMFKLPPIVNATVDSDTASVDSSSLTVASIETLSDEQKSQLIPIN